ncbi:MAG: alpha/beta hydrolase, partial [Achromobacter sp.]|nr:alpha/beta hydrolase [Achromobacter sp.]
MKAIVQELRAGAALAQQDKEFLSAARGLPCAIWLQADAGPGEKITVWAGQPAGPSQCIVVSAPADVWQKMLGAEPPPGYHSFTAARRQLH